MARIETDPNYTTPTFSRATAATDLFKKEDVQQVAAALSTHDHSTGKGLVIPFATTIPTGSITSTMIADGTIATADMAAHASTRSYQASGVTSSPTTTSTSFVDLPDMSVSVTPTAIGDLYAIITITLQFSLSATAAYVALNLDGGAEQGPILTSVGTASGSTVLTVAWVFRDVSAAAHTIKGRWMTGAGTLTAYATHRTLTVLELRR